MWMRVVGIELGADASVWKRYMSRVLGSILVSFTILSRGEQMVNAFNTLKLAKTIIQSGATNPNVTSVTITQAVNDVLMNFQAIVAAIGIHVAMFVVYLFRWQSLSKCLKKLERDPLHPKDLHYRIRRASLIAVGWLCAVKYLPQHH